MTRAGRPSLMFALMRAVAAPVAAVILLIAGGGYAAASFEINEVYDAQLVTLANLLGHVAADQSTPTRLRMEPDSVPLNARERTGLTEFTQWRSFRLWRDGRLRVASNNAPPDGRPGAPGFADVRDETGRWRIYTLALDGGATIVEARENVAARGEEISSIFWSLVLPVSLVLPLVCAVIWWGIRRGLSGLRRFAEAVASRSPDDLSPIATDAVPAELAPLGGSINALLATLKQSLEQERLFTDNAAHELRTPLAALQAQAGVVAGARNAAERSDALAEMQRGAGRAARLLDQLLTLARLRQMPPAAQPLKLGDLAREAIQDTLHQAAQRGIELSLDGDDGARIDGDPVLFGLIVRNLLDNAIKFSPAGGQVEMVMARDGEGAPALQIRDHGPGIAEAERERVFGRFYRVKGQTEPGSGLGLAIARLAAERAGCRIVLAQPTDGTGLEAAIHFALNSPDPKLRRN